MLLALLLASAVPGGHLYLGAGANAQPNGGGGFSLELNVEVGHFVGGATLELGDPWALFMLRAAYVLTESRYGPYAGVGFGSAAEGGIRMGDGDGRSGPAIVPELGVLFPRDWEFGRVNVYAQVIQPLNVAHWDPGPGDVKTGVSAGVRLFL